MKILKIIPALLVGLVIALAGAVGPASATDPNAQISEWHTWRVTSVLVPSPSNADDVSWPQTYVGKGQIAPTECGVWYQQDKYVGTRAQIDAVITSGDLTKGEDYHLTDRSIGGDWTFVYGGDCTDPEPPIKPKPLVVTDTKEVKDCEALTVTTVLTTTTTGWTLVENVWVKDEPGVVTASSERAATAEECPPVVETPEPAAPSLAATGGTGPNIPFAIGVLALLLASIAILAGHIVRRRQLTQE